MSRFQIELARPEDDLPLRRLLAANSMEGSIELAFLREPSYFLATSVQAPFHQVVVARDSHGGEPVGVGFRGVRPTYLNGEAVPVGYLADLRLAEEYRGGSLVARGYRYFRQLHGDGRAMLYLTVIAEENETALRTIASGRAGLPHYRPLGTISTPAVNLSPSSAGRQLSLEVRRASAGDREEIVACLARNLSRRQFAPVFDIERCRGLAWNDFYVACRGRKIVAAAARWDQGSFRQTRVVRYRGLVRLLRPFYNAAAPLVGSPRYPAAGEMLRSFYVSFVAVDDDDADVFRSVLQKIHDDHVGSGYHYLIAGLHENDPLAPALKHFRLTPFRARAFAVHFDDGKEAFESLDRRVPYVEVAML